MQVGRHGFFYLNAYSRGFCYVIFIAKLLEARMFSGERNVRNRKMGNAVYPELTIVLPKVAPRINVPKLVFMENTNYFYFSFYRRISGSRLIVAAITGDAQTCIL